MAQTKRYQIFVSSTYKDLKAERREVIEAILELHHLPLGMEMFPASNVAPPEYIKRAIAESDYYVVIVGNRYGTPVPGSGLSFTEMEYDHAIACGVPVVAMIHENPSSLADESNEERKVNLDAFRAKLRGSKLVREWRTSDDLARKVSSSLVHLFNDEERPGWVRANTNFETNTIPTDDPLNPKEAIALGGTYVDVDGVKQTWQCLFNRRSVLLSILSCADSLAFEGLIEASTVRLIFEQATGLVVGKTASDVELENRSFVKMRNLLRAFDLLEVDNTQVQRPWKLTAAGRKRLFQESELDGNVVD